MLGTALGVDLAPLPSAAGVPTGQVSEQSSAAAPPPPQKLSRFAFEVELGFVGGSHARVQERCLPAKAQALTFFSVQKLKPSRVKVPRLAPALSESAVAILVYDICKWDVKNRVAEVSLDKSEEQVRQPHILNSNLLTLDDFNSMAQWADKEALVYDVGGLSVDSGLMEPFQSVVSGLLQNTEIESGSAYIHIDEIDPGSRQMSCLQAFSANGFAQQTSSVPGAALGS